jgi:hypothetical protein
MTVVGTVRNGVIVLPPDAKLPDGAQVEVILPDAPVPEDSFVDLVQQLAKPRPHLPADYALNHGHYVRGEPKQ